MTSKVNKKLIIVIIIIVSAIVMIIGISWMLRGKDEIQTVSGNKYDANDIIEVAMRKLKEGGSAEVVSNIQTTDKLIALTFQGLSDAETNRKILDLMAEYERKGTFFVPGILAAEDSNTIIAMNSEGHRIGNNTLSETKHMEEYTKEDLVKDFSRTNNIIQTIIGKAPNTLLCNSTTHTPELLQAAHACGNDKVVKSTHYLSYQSFKNYNQVLGYIKGLEKGAILTIKMDGTLDEEEYEAPVKPDKPAIDKAPSINSEDMSLDSLTKEERLLKMMEWILQALKETEYKTVFAEDLSAYDDADFNMNFSNLRDQNAGKLSKVYTNINTTQHMMSFAFRGIEDEEQLTEILNFLEENHLLATFFVTVNDIVNYPERIDKILEKKQNIANGGLSGKDLTTMSFQEICLEIYKCDKLLKEIYGVHTNIFMPVYGKSNELIQEAASIFHYDVVTYSKNPITDDAKSIDDIMGYYKNGFKDGDIIYFRIGYHKDLLNIVKQTYEMIAEGTYAICDIPTLLVHESNETEMVSNNGNSTKGTQTDSKNTNKPNGNTANNQNSGGSDTNTKKEAYTVQYLDSLRRKNKGVKAKEQHTVYTTEQALSYTFYGINHNDILKDVLHSLKLLNAKGTFFVTEKDIINSADAIKQIAKEGHEIGICLMTSTGTDFYSMLSSILTIQKEVEALCGQKPTLVRYAYEVEMSDEMLEAVSSARCRVIWQDLSLASSKLGIDATLEDVIKNAFNEGNITARRGYIIYYRMDYYSNPTLIGKLMLNIAKERIDTIAYKDGIADNGSTYSIKTLGALLSSDMVYSYPVSDKKVLPSLKNAIYPGHFDGLTDALKFQFVQGRYIGTPSINSSSTLPGFSDEELDELDKTGAFTDDKVLFLTFDDWGSDKAVNQLLYVLNKYNIKASFFVRTNYVESNPNLLRAIAEAGHDVGSHTDMHNPFATTDIIQDENDNRAIYYSLTDDEIKERKEDLLISYQKLLSIIGDVRFNGIPSLTKILRPPTLAMSSSGMEAILDMGFKYIVSGDFSTHDYEEVDPKALANTIMNGIKLDDGERRTLHKGSVLVMHMSDNDLMPKAQNVTAEALDIVIPKLIAEGYQFAKLSDYLTDSRGEVYNLSQSYIDWLAQQGN
ncbi:polysaccharide deacetylase family protein [Lachnoclostridium phytofermentans]|uniref:Polysaccharide deacetylase n=1 Tax=Lachnoclostridium phytofermentans (strain ATCC 700394 / DSM 18823 / ISDg) TaxID=357809 RepID=A9KK07_LACP7|nr:polysaccharide deacetylase family protein [Lachnoclostridium phytofermentans]ABX42579.1 polysaccharide deacetylase [Lachnoclostridium phytofermentans ISDg]